MAVIDYTKKDWARETLDGLADLWRARRPAPDRLPARRDFDMVDFKAVLGWVCIYDVERMAPPRLKIRLEGTAIQELDGAAWTGRYLDEKFPPGRYPRVFEPYERALASRRPVVVHRDVPVRTGTWRHLAKLVLPLADDGVTPDKTIAVLHYAHRLYEDVEPGELVV